MFCIVVRLCYVLPGFVAVPLGMFSVSGISPTTLTGTFNSANAAMVPANK